MALLNKTAPCGFHSAEGPGALLQNTRASFDGFSFVADIHSEFQTQPLILPLYPSSTRQNRPDPPLLFTTMAFANCKIPNPNSNHMDALLDVQIASVPVSQHPNSAMDDFFVRDQPLPAPANSYQRISCRAACPASGARRHTTKSSILGTSTRPGSTPTSSSHL
jgi:hypothetical protein